jgi:hypothetical protein
MECQYNSMEGLARVVQRAGTTARGSVGAQMTGPLGNAGFSCANVGVHNRQPCRPSRALARKQAKKSEEAVRDWVTLRKCDKGKQSDCGFPLVALGCRLFPCLEGVERWVGGLEGGGATHNRRHDRAVSYRLVIVLPQNCG